MMRRLVRAAIQNATVNGSSLALRIDPVILRAANILPLEEVELVNQTTSERVTTFAEPGASGQVLAPQMRAGDVISILSWGTMHDGQTLAHKATIVTLDATNTVIAVTEV
jgi:aspartate 1-decarboxylase